MKALFYLILNILCLKNSYAIDLQPGEIIAPPPNITYAQLSYVNASFDGLYSNQLKQGVDYRYNIHQTLFRLGRSFKIFDNPAAIYGQLPVADYDLQGDLSKNKTDSDSGFGDVTIMTALWPYANRETNKYLGIGAYLVLPVGSYNHKRMVNIGENRTKFALQLAYQQPVIKDIDIMMAIDSVMFGDNNEYSSSKKMLSQNNLYTGQIGLRYKITPLYSIAVNLYHTEGGEKIIDNVFAHDYITTNRYQLTAQGDYSFGRITVQYGQDIDVKNGAKEDNRCIIRYTIAL